jgi:uracil-DNA glycosylase family 4
MKRTFVHPYGNLEATLAICGEQPGVQEIRGNPPRPFIGPAGQGLDECLGMVKIIRRDLYLTNVIKDLDMPLAHYMNIDYKKHKYEISTDGYTYIRELGEELKNLHLNCIVALGNVALIALTSRMGIGKWRGSVIESTLVPGLKVVPTYHPATFIAPKFNFLNKPLICEDLKRAAIESEYSDIRRLPRKCYIKPRYDQAIYALNHCYEAGLRGQTITVDLEIINGEVDCFSVGWTAQHSICIPLRCQQGDYFTPEEELEVLLLLAKIIQEERISKSGANFIFDLQFLFRKYGMRPRGTIHCTQIAQKISLPDYPAGLDFVTTTHTDIPYYKADGKEWMRMGAGTWEKWWEYNAMDSIVPQDALPKQLEVLRKQNNLITYDRQRKLIEPLLYMGEKGIKVDVQAMMDYKEEQQKELDKLAEELNEVVGRDINYNSPDQMMTYFYKDCGIKPYKSRTTGNDTSNVDALKRIFRLNVKGSKAARIMLDIRRLSKRISTYLNVGKVDPDGRYRSSYKPVGAETGRLSSGETIFGTGGNQQNWPHDLLRFFLFDEGYIGYSLDLSQIENRIVAYVGGVIPQIEAFEQGIDLHRLTASVIFNKPYDQISGVDGSSDLGDGRQSERYWGKKGNHALNYDVGYKTFALVNEMTETEAKQIMERIHKGYPQIRGGYHVIIQNMLKRDRTIVNLFGRTRVFLGPVYPSHQTPLSMCENTYREAYAQMAQSTCADKVNEQGIEHIYYNQQWYEPLELLAQVHDSIVFQIPLTVPWTIHAEIILRIKQSLETPLTWHDVEFPTPVDLAIGLNMCKEQMMEFKSKSIPNSPALLAEKLEETYNGLTRSAVPVLS